MTASSARTTAAVAQKLGRRWIGCDINKGAIQTTAKRLQAIICEQAAAQAAQAQQALLPTMATPPDEAAEPQPSHLAFAVYRVNDYDLQIQHNEAVNLACEAIGVARSKADAFFDGTLGSQLVKITPFNHPLTALDLEEIRRELEARPEEERDVVVVALGKETAVDAWLEEWHRLRRQTNLPNKIAVELLARFSGGEATSRVFHALGFELLPKGTALARQARLLCEAADPGCWRTGCAFPNSRRGITTQHTKTLPLPSCPSWFSSSLCVILASSR